MNAKQKMLRIVCVIELIVLVGVYCLSPYGLRVVFQLQHENKQLEKKIIDLQNKIAPIEAEIDQWTHDFFYIEQYAREKLAMARKDEAIYLLSN